MCDQENLCFIDTLRQILNLYHPINDDNWDLLAPHLIEQSYGEKEHVHSFEQVCDYILFVKTGTFRAYYRKNEESETNLLLCGANEFVTDYESFIRDTTSTLAVQAIDGGKVILLPRTALVDLYEKTFYWNKFGRLVAEQIYIECKRRIEELLFLSPEERYLKLMEEKPHYFQQFPLKHIAAYLGIQAPSLSRIRARLATN